MNDHILLTMNTDVLRAIGKVAGSDSVYVSTKDYIIVCSIPDNSDIQLYMWCDCDLIKNKELFGTTVTSSMLNQEHGATSLFVIAIINKTTGANIMAHEKIFTISNMQIRVGEVIEARADKYIGFYINPEVAFFAHDPYVKDGIKKVYHPSGLLAEETTYADGKKHGMSLTYYDKLGDPYDSWPKSSVVKTKCFFKNNKLHGKYRDYNKDYDVVREATYQNGMLIGESYNRENDKTIRNSYTNGMKDGLEKVYNRGKLVEETVYKNDKKHGISRIFDSKFGVSRLVEECNYKDGCRHGICKVYKPMIGMMSKLSSVKYYIDNVEVSKETYTNRQSLYPNIDA